MQPTKRYLGGVRGARVILALVWVIAGAACSSSPGADTGTDASGLRTVTLSLDYLANNASFAGIYAAIDQGYYKAAGLNVKIQPYVDTPAEVLVGAGKANFGTTDQTSLALANATGATLMATAALLQHDPLRMAVAPKFAASIASPADLSGRTFGGFGSPLEAAVNKTMIKTAGGNPDYKTVAMGADVYTVLQADQIDWALAYQTDDVLWAQMDGHPLKTFDPNSFGVPDLYGRMLVVDRSFAVKNPALVAAFTQATVKGYQFEQASPEQSVDILDKAGVGTMDLTKQKATAKMIAADYSLAPNGAVGPIDPARMTTVTQFLQAAGLLMDSDGKPLTTTPDSSTWSTDKYLSGNGS